MGSLSSFLRPKTKALRTAVGWVNLYQKFEIEKIQFMVNSFYQKNGKAFC